MYHDHVCYAEQKLKKIGHNLRALLNEVESLENTPIHVENVEKKNIERASVFYDNRTKSFEYFNIGHVAHGYDGLPNTTQKGQCIRAVDMPDLDSLRNSAKNFVHEIKKVIKKDLHSESL